MNDDTMEFMELMEGSEADTEPQQLKCQHVKRTWNPNTRITTTNFICRRTASWLYEGRYFGRVVFTLLLCDGHKKMAARSVDGSIFTYQLTRIDPEPANQTAGAE
jgi:hypothetical protein